MSNFNDSQNLFKMIKFEINFKKKLGSNFNQINSMN